jgi:hypothetical protein
MPIIADDIRPVDPSAMTPSRPVERTIRVRMQLADATPEGSIQVAMTRTST